MEAIHDEYPPTLSQEQLDHILVTIKDWAIGHGLAVRTPAGFLSASQDPQGIAAIPAPVTLFPSLFPRSCFLEAVAVQQTYNELYARISMDEEWLGEIIQELIGVDEFIQRLWQIHEKVKKDGYVQPLQLGLFRSDYMVNLGPHSSTQIKQVEFNTISSSFGGLSTQVAALHKYLLDSQVYNVNPYLSAASLPPNDATTGLAEGLIAAHQAYASKRKTKALICILFIVQEGERNIFDQRALEYVIQAKSISVFRLPFGSTMQHTRVSDDIERRLLYTPAHALSTEYEVSVVYLRSTYTPADFVSERDWDTRYQLERSAAIKCPSILNHLAGSKKVQQVLATPSSPYLERFLDKEKADQVRKSFTTIYPLDDSEAGRRAKILATDPVECKSYVLKPQREGGGNNVYRSAIPPFLKSLGDEAKWKGHILMELIEPPPQKNSIFRGGVLKSGEVITELGVFGACLWGSDDQSIIYNTNAGYLLRTKGRESEEGGVAAGFGAIDSVCLVDSFDTEAGKK